MCQGVKHPLEITVNNKKLEVVNEFTYLVTALRILRPTGASGKQPLPLPVWKKESGKTAIWPSKPRWLYTELLSSAPSLMAASLGIYTLDRKRGWMHFICEICGTSSASSDLTMWQTRRSTPKLESRVSPFLLQQHRFCWLGHVHHMPDGSPKNLPLTTGKRGCGSSHVQFRDICKRDLKSTQLISEVGRSWPLTESGGD